MICRICSQDYTQPVPVRWLAKYPELAGRCPRCVAEWVMEQL